MSIANNVRHIYHLADCEYEHPLNVICREVDRLGEAAERQRLLAVDARSDADRRLKLLRNAYEGLSFLEDMLRVFLDPASTPTIAFDDDSRAVFSTCLRRVEGYRAAILAELVR